MGLDVNLYAEGVVTDEELAAATMFFEDRDVRGRPVRSSYWPNRIEIDMDGTRYYGPHYERGPWPEIATTILVTVAAFPQCTVHYGSDDEDEPPSVDQDALDEIWAHWLGPHWNDYRRGSRAGMQNAYVGMLVLMAERKVTVAREESGRYVDIDWRADYEVSGLLYLDRTPGVRMTTDDAVAVRDQLNALFQPTSLEIDA